MEDFGPIFIVTALLLPIVAPLAWFVAGATGGTFARLLPGAIPHWIRDLALLLVFAILFTLTSAFLAVLVAQGVEL